MLKLLTGRITELILHLIFDYDGCLSVFADQKYKVKVAQKMTFLKGAIIMMDREYNDNKLFEQLSADPSAGGGLPDLIS